jgi:fibronectin-binding autotransporter adhesin
MKFKRLSSIGMVISLGFGFVMSLLGLLRVTAEAAQAAPSGELRVCTNGCMYTSLQAAVDAANPGDMIKVAEGTYTDIHLRQGITQVVYISKSLSILGGYTAQNWDIPAPDQHPTILDAGGQGRAMVISDTQGVTIQGLSLTGGNAQGLGGAYYQEPAGGGLYVQAMTVTLTNNHIYSNSAQSTWSPAGFGGGIYVRGDAITITNNLIEQNLANSVGQGFGGGIQFYDCHHVLIKENIIQGNSAAANGNGDGGGIDMVACKDVRIEGNTIAENMSSNGADASGGGVYLSGCDLVTINRNRIQKNLASRYGWGYGGGLYLRASNRINLDSNIISENIAAANPNAAGWGGGAYLAWNEAQFSNNVFADNHAITTGSGLYLAGSTLRLVHTTVARNHGGDAGIYVGSTPWGDDRSNVEMLNTIIVSHTVGITVTANNTLTLNATLWHANTDDFGGDGTLNHAQDYAGDPDFSADGYHIQSGSAAIDQGVDAGVTTDVDGEARPQGGGYDLGVDEQLKIFRVYLPMMAKSPEMKKLVVP